MELENQVCALEYSKKFRELGVPQKSLYFWRGVSNNQVENPANWYYSWNLYPSDFRDGLENARTQYYSAFTVAELGEMLPAEVFSGKKLTTETANPDSQLIEYIECWYNRNGYVVEADTLANAMAKMLIYLLEHKLINL